MIVLNRVKKHACLFLCVLGLSLLTNAQGFVKANGQKIVDGQGQNLLLRGIGLGGWMLQEGYMLKVNGIGQQQHVIRQNIEELIGTEKTNEFYASWLANHTTRKDIEALKAWGFNSIRLPMHFNLYTLPIEKEPVKGQNTWLEQGFQMTDSLLAWCKDNELYLILDLHAAPGGQGNDLNISDADPNTPFLWQSEENLAKTVALWKKLAERYKNETWIAAYDIINEPNWGFTDAADKNGLKEPVNGPLKKLMQDITTAIRSVDQNHLIIIEGNGWGNNYNGILPPWDDNMALSFHKYWNFNTPESIKGFLDFRSTYNVPIWLGETGENSNVWFTQAIQLMEKNNIGWCWWPLKKIGLNNPIEIKSNTDYDAVLAYWSKKGAKPSPEQAYKGVMELARATHIDNGVVRKDVLDAMFRQVRSATAVPFAQHTIKPGAVIQAADYDLGSNGIAYLDRDTGNYHVSTGKRSAGNRGHAYRNDGVDISLAANGALAVTHTAPGEWLQYTVEVEEAGKYQVQLLVKALKAARAAIEVNGKRMDISVRQTSGDAFAPVSIDGVTLPKGTATLRIHFTTGDVDLQSIRFNKTS